MESFRSVNNDVISFAVSPDSPCSCGSQEPASHCCLKAADYRKAPVSTFPPPPKTDKSHESCYAHCLADCDSQLSREHYISESLLRYLNRANHLRVSGFSWIKEQGQLLPPNAFASKMLCKRHNSALAKLDAIAVRLFQSFDDRELVGSGQKLIYFFSGHDIERWLLKILCGIAYSRNVPLNNEVDLQIPEYWLRILFGESEFPYEQGLYVCKSPGHRFDGAHALEVEGITARGRLNGIGIRICGYELILSMSGFPSRRFDGREFAYRPFEFYVTGHDFEIG